MANDPKTPTKRTAAARAKAPAAPPRKTATASKAAPAPVKAAAKRTTSAGRTAPALAVAASAPAAPAGVYTHPDTRERTFWNGSAWDTGVDVRLVDGLGTTPPVGPDSAEDGVVGPGLIRLNGREIAVTRPTEATLLVLKRMAGQVERSPSNREQAARLAERMLNATMSVLPNQADRDWLEDSIMDETLPLDSCGFIMRYAIESFVGPQAAAPKTGPTKATRRRK